MIKRLLLLQLVFVTGFCFGQNTTKLTDKQKTEIIDDVCQLLTDHYVFPDTAAKYVSCLKKKLKSGVYKNISDPTIFSDLINKDLNSVHKDGHLQTQYNPAFAARLRTPQQDNLSSEGEPLKKLKAENFGLTKVEILKGNIGYLNISKFRANDVYGRETVNAALKFLSNTNAIIIDLRYCGGGSPKTVSLIIGYFLKERTHLADSYNRSANTTTEFWTTPDTALKMLFDIPLYVLTSEGTFSASEEFCYDLQNLKRAKIVGAKTAGGAHNTFEQPVMHGFVIYIPYGRMVNAVTKSNWEGIGIIPDIQVSSDKALEIAEADIFKRLLEKPMTDSEKYDLKWQYDFLNAANNPVYIDTLTLKKYSGVYGERTFTLENGRLYYQRTGKPKFELEPMTKTVMRGKGNEYFKIEFIESNGEVNEVKAYYQDYRVESSKRSAE